MSGRAPLRPRSVGKCWLRWRVSVVGFRCTTAGRPNLRDESDNHLIELAIAGHARAVVTHNVRDLTRGELVWPHLRILTPVQFLEELP